MHIRWFSQSRSSAAWTHAPQIASNPFNPVGRRFDRLLQDYLSGAFAMSCPPIRGSRIKGESQYYADVVLAGPDLVGDTTAAARLRCRLQLFARKLANALGLSARGLMMLEPRTIGPVEEIMSREGGKRSNRTGEVIEGHDRGILPALPKRSIFGPKLSTPGRSVAGIDGCKAGWVMVRRDENDQFDKPIIVKTLAELPRTDSVLIDIPIGLPDGGRRKCDLAAGTLLGTPRRSSVFTGARRPLLAKKDRESAHAWGREHDGIGVNVQLWAILPKIREADAWITPERQKIFREGHPELSFCHLAGRPMKHNKRKKAGRIERLDALAEFVGRELILEWLQQTRGSGAAADDILDALALCWSAARLALGCHSAVPADPAPQDGHSLSMEMVY